MPRLWLFRSQRSPPGPRAPKRPRSTPTTSAASSTGADGPEAGVWVIAETDAFADALREDRRHRRPRPLRRSRSAAGRLSALGARLRPRGFRQGRPARPGKTLNLTRRRRRRRPPRRSRVSGRVLVLDDEGAAGERSRALARRRQSVPRVGQEPVVHRLPSDRPARDAHVAAEFASHESHEALGAAHSIRPGRRTDARVRDESARRRAAEVSRRVDRPRRGRRAAARATRSGRSGVERNIVATVRDWSTDKAYMHDLSGTDRRNPTVNAYGKLYGAPELSTDEFPILDPKTNTATVAPRARSQDPNTPTTQEHAADATVRRTGAAKRSGTARRTRTTRCSMSKAASGTRPSCARRTTRPRICKAGSDHPSAKLFPLRALRPAAVRLRSEDARSTRSSTRATRRITCSSPRTRTTRCGRAAAVPSSAG